MNELDFLKEMHDNLSKTIKMFIHDEYNSCGIMLGAISVEFKIRIKELQKDENDE